MADHEQGLEPTKKKGVRSHATKMVNLVAARVKAKTAELFHNTLGEPFITLQEPEQVTLAIRSPEFRDWLSRDYFVAAKTAPGESAVKEAANTIAGSARFTGPTREVFVRVASLADRVFIDLGHAIAAITADGWTLQPHATDVCFLRTAGFLPLPQPARTDRSLRSLLQDVINVPDDDAAMLLTAWLVGAARGRKPFPILDVVGEQGSAKTSACKFLRRILDPNVADTRVKPKEMRDLMIAARNNYLIAFDNLTRLDEELTNGLCCLATGAGSATRALTTDTNEIIINAARPILLNGINDVMNRADLLDRAIIVPLPRIAEHQRRTEVQAEAHFAALLPAILGALFDAVACALRHEPTLTLDRLPRMADFATTVVAASPALGWTGEHFLTVYGDARREASDAMLESNSVANAVRVFMHDKPEWTSSSDELLKAITNAEREKDKYWPHNAKALNNRLRDLAPGLRAAGLDITFGRTKDGRFVEIKNEHVGQGLKKEPEQPALKSDDQIPF